MIVGARKRRREVGMRTRLSVVMYVAVGDLWAFTINDAHGAPISRSVATSATELGVPWAKLTASLHTLLDVRVAHAGSRLVRDDERWDVAVRLVGGADELPFRVS